jgi:REP element-mobilizing transposase RayT
MEWIPLFVDARYIDPVIDSLRYCQQSKGLALHGFVVMPNHVHLVAAADDKLEQVMADFKRFTSRRIKELLVDDGRASLMEWFRRATPAERAARGEIAFWQRGFHPKAVFSEQVFLQKMKYLHENPVRKGLVRRPEHWWYSSAAQYEGSDDLCLSVEQLGF